MFSPIVAIASVISSRTVCSVSRNGCSSRQTSLNHFLSWPSTIWARIASGFFWVAGSASSSARLASRTSAGMRSASTYSGSQPGDLDREVPDELLELLVAGDEVGLAVDLDEHADPAAGVDVAADRGPRGPRGRPSSRRPPGRAREQRDGRVDVAAGLLEGALAVHEPGAGQLAQLLDRLGRDVRHVVSCAPVPWSAARGDAGDRASRGGDRRQTATGVPLPAGLVGARSLASRASSAAISSGEASAGGGSTAAAGAPGAGQEVVLVRVGLEGQGRAAGEGRDERVGRLALLDLGLDRGDRPRARARRRRGRRARGRLRWPRRRRASRAAGSPGSRRRCPG